MSSKLKPSNKTTQFLEYRPVSWYRLPVNKKCCYVPAGDEYFAGNILFNKGVGNAFRHTVESFGVCDILYGFIL